MTWKPSRLYFGADYNPEQWDPSTWPDDVSAMVDMGVNMVTLGVFSWAVIEPEPDKYVFGWLDDVMELLHDAGIRIDLATATASPPPWLPLMDPAVCAVRPDGSPYSHGGRQHYSASSRTYKERAGQLVDQMASRYQSHPGVEMWHVNNEYACHVPQCYGPEAEKAFREWLISRYRTIDQLNDAWQTRFWSQNYSDFEQITPPRLVGATPNPGQVLDFQRFSSHQWLELFRLEKSVIRRHDHTHPLTTNFMTMRHFSSLNYWEWVDEVDFVSTDHYVDASDPTMHVELAFQADLTRGLARGKPWLLMEHSPSAVNWQPRNTPKTDGEILRHSLSHIARGSNGAMFFQFKQSRGGSERFHAAMVPHVGRDSRITRAMTRLGEAVRQLGNLNDAAVQKADVAIIWDYESLWALSLENLPTVDLNYFESVYRMYRAMFALGVRVDILPPSASAEDLAHYTLVLAPALHLVDDTMEKTISDYVDNGGHFITGYFSAVADRAGRVRLGGYGGDLIRRVCGVAVEEWAPLLEGETLTLSNGYQATVWSELATCLSATPLAHYPTDHPVSGGSVALSRNTFGEGIAWYVGSELTDDSMESFFSAVLSQLGLPGAGSTQVEVVTRGTTQIIINHSAQPVTVGEVDVAAGGWTAAPK